MMSSTSGGAATSAAASATLYSARGLRDGRCRRPRWCRPRRRSAARRWSTVFALASLAQTRCTSMGAVSSRSGGSATGGNCNSPTDAAAQVSRSALSVAELMRCRIGAVLPSGRPPSVVFWITLAAMMRRVDDIERDEPDLEVPVLRDLLDRLNLFGHLPFPLSGGASRLLCCAAAGAKPRRASRTTAAGGAGNAFDQLSGLDRVAVVEEGAGSR